MFFFKFVPQNLTKTTRLRGEKENWKIWEGCVYKLRGIKLKRRRGIWGKQGKRGGKPSNSSHSFPLESLILRGNELCLGSINIYNSFFNLWAYLCMEEIMDLRNSCLNCLNYIENMLISIINCWDKLQLKHNYVFF